MKIVMSVASISAVVSMLSVIIGTFILIMGKAEMAETFFMMCFVSFSILAMCFSIIIVYLIVQEWKE